MKKSIKILMITAMFGLFASSCGKMNDLPTFNDKDAFVAFSSATASFNENAGTVNIPVTLVSLRGFTTSVSFKVIEGSAKSGVNFTVAGANSLNFTPESPIQNIQIQIINRANLFTGDVSFSIELDNPGAVNLGAAKKITVNIADLDHPLATILGNWTASGESYLNGDQSWTITLAKDARDVSKVWITNFVAGGSSASTPIFGIVDKDMTWIHVPVYQIIATSSSYPLIRLEGFYGPDGDDDIEDGGYITIVIAPNKRSMTIMDEFGSAVYDDAGGSDFLGWYNIFVAGIVMTKD